MQNGPFQCLCYIIKEHFHCIILLMCKQHLYVVVAEEEIIYLFLYSWAI